MPTIILIEDHEVVRRGLRAVLEAEGDLEIIGEAADGVSAVALAEAHKPDVVITDLMIPGLNGLEVTRQISQRSPHTRVIVLSMHANEAYVVQALNNGAAGYVLKDASTADVIHAVREALAGHRFLSAPLSDRVIDAYISKLQDTAVDVYDTLTNREREILHLAAEGHTNAQISERFSISPRTVEVHRANLMHKLGLRSQTDLIRYALRRGILPMDKKV